MRELEANHVHLGRHFERPFLEQPTLGCSKDEAVKRMIQSQTFSADYCSRCVYGGGTSSTTCRLEIRTLRDI